MNDAISQFKNAIRTAGLEPPEVIEPGEMYRFPGMGKCNGNTAGWCIFFEDRQGGCFGDWSSGLSENWQAEREKPYSPSERATFRKKVDEARKKSESVRQKQRATAAANAKSIWENAVPANEDHPYLLRKGIKAHGLRIDQGALVIPLLSGSEIQSLQFIAEDGNKRFLKGGRVSGGYYIIGNDQGADVLCIAEGFATGATIHKATGYPVAVAFNGNNLESVAHTIRKNKPDLRIIICADDDVDTEGNPGITTANQAAQAVGATVAVPDFGDQRALGMTDFNDMASLCGSEAVATIIQKAITSAHPNDASWSEPLPLTAKITPEAYPIDALPETVRAAVEEVHAFTKAPIPLVASSALAALSLAVQAHADVKRAEKLQGPTGLFLLTVADSGERKSTCDGFFMQAIRDYEAEQGEASKSLLNNHRTAMEAWKAKQTGVKDKIRTLSRSGKITREEEARLQDLVNNEPEQPRVPRLIYADATPEALKWSLAKDWPSGGVISSEAGLVFGSHGMGKDSIMRNLATLNQFWDGVDIATERRTSESFTVRGARLTIALQVQEATLRNFFNRTDGLARGTGFLARFLVSWPESTQGYRLFTEAPKSWPALERFNQRITRILEQEVPIGENGALSPPVVPLTVDTKAAWVEFHDAIEKELRTGGELYDVRDVASKIADNAARVATLFQVFEYDGDSAVGIQAFEGASRITAWHLNEARRFYGELALLEEQADAIKLDSWLIDTCLQERTNFVPRRDVQRKVTPRRLRQKIALDVALGVLVEADRVRLIQNGKRKEIHVNPSLLNGKEE